MANYYDPIDESNKKSSLGVGAKSVYNDLRGTTTLDNEIEKELCERIAVIEKEGSLVPPLEKIDWIISIALIVFISLVPVFVMATKLGID